MYTLYSLGGSCSTGITILLRKLGADFMVIQRGDVADYATRVPTNQVPALEDSGLLLTEGAAIVLYLLEKHQSDMLPHSLQDKAEFTRWLMFNYATLHPAYNRVITVNRCIDDSDPSKATILQTLADKLSTTWKIVNDRLSTREYMYGNKVSIIDYLLTIYTSWGKMFESTQVELGEHVVRLAKHVSQLPEFIWAYEQEKTVFSISQLVFPEASLGSL